MEILKDAYLKVGKLTEGLSIGRRLADLYVELQQFSQAMFEYEFILGKDPSNGEVVAAMAWDTGGWKLNSENPEIKFIAPKSGALGWIDTFAIPAKGRNDDAAYQWINFNMRPEIAAKVAAAAGNFTASNGADKLMQGKLKEQFAESFPKAAIDNIKWYPAVPAGIEEIEGKVLDRLKAGS